MGVYCVAVSCEGRLTAITESLMEGLFGDSHCNLKYGSLPSMRGRLSMIALFACVLAACREPTFGPGQGPNKDSSNPVGTTSVAGSSFELGQGSQTTKGASSNPTGQTSSSGTLDKGEPDPGACPRPGASRRCSSLEDGSQVVFPLGTPVGRCRYGQQECLGSGQWGPCRGTVAPLAADDCARAGDDANCDGIANSGCQCVVGVDKSRSCGSNVGQCRYGTQSCTAQGIWSDCQDEIRPSIERCDGASRDEDCDGKADLADDDCECLTTMAPIACKIEGGQGDCGLGSTRCVDGRLSGCLPRFPKTAEFCGPARSDGLGQATGDEDCDGNVDDADGPLEPLNCTFFILDLDQDGWGARGQSFIEAGKQATYGCFCGYPGREEVGDRNFVQAKDRSRVNSDCGDCYGGEEVFPGQTKYFETASACLEGIGWDGGAFDYNCDGRSEKQHTGLLVGDCMEAPNSDNEHRECVWSADSVGHWLEGADPACGKEGLVPKCRISKASTGDSWGCDKFTLPAYVDTQKCR